MNQNGYGQAIQIAAGFLAKAGFEVPGRERSTAAGQLDLVARHGRVHVVCVVTTRPGNRYGRRRRWSAAGGCPGCGSWASRG